MQNVVAFMVLVAVVVVVAPIKFLGSYKAERETLVRLDCFALKLSSHNVIHIWRKVWRAKSD